MFLENSPLLLSWRVHTWSALPASVLGLRSSDFSLCSTIACKYLFSRSSKPIFLGSAHRLRSLFAGRISKEGAIKDGASRALIAKDTALKGPKSTVNVI